jgi:phosphoribosylglycinamide formyltransferase-1
MYNFCYGKQSTKSNVLKNIMKKIVVLASGEGSNFSAIVDSGIEVEKVLTDNPKAGVIKRAIKSSVPVIVLDKKEYMQIQGWFEHRLDEEIPNDTDLIVLAGFMLILSSWFCEKWAGKIINIHPSLLPAFGGGCHAIKDAWEYGCKIFGVTIHWVIPEVDAGPIITQRAIHKLDDDTLEIITERTHNVEHYVYPETIKKLMRI